MASEEFQPAVSGANTFAQDLNQIIQALSGQIDVGQLSLFQPVPNPVAPTLAKGAAGNPNGTYLCQQVLVTGFRAGNGSLVVVGFAPSLGASIAVAGYAITWTLATGPTGTLGRLGFRTIAGGGAGTELYAFWVPDNTTTSWTDNVADAALGTGMPGPSSSPPVVGNAIPAGVPPFNTTGTVLVGAGSNLLTSPQFYALRG